MSGHPHRATIAPVNGGTPRPRWSVMIPAYNAAHYLGATLTSVLAQDPGPEIMQIEVVDDHSSDDPAAVVAQVGRGRVSVVRQERNVGHVRNFETCLQRARGRLVHLLHGDDCVREGFYRTMERAFDEPAVGAAFCRYIAMDEQGHWQNVAPLEQPASGILPHWLETIAAGQRLQPSCMVVRREVYEQLGGFDERIRHYGEDWEMWVRIAAHHAVWYETEPLALYRVRSASLSGRSLRTGENVQDLRRVIEINRESLPAERADELSGRALEACALAALRRGRRLLAHGELRGPVAQAREALRSRRTLRVTAEAALLVGAWAATAAYRAVTTRSPP